MIWWLLFILADIYGNYYWIEKKHSKPNYKALFLYRGFFAVAHASLVMQVLSWSEYLPIFIFQTTSFWLLFDLGLNFLRKKPLDYKGDHSGWLDKLPPRIYWSLKVIALFGAIFVLLNTKNY